MKEPINNFTQVMSTCPPGEYWKNWDLIERRLKSLEESLEGLTQQRQESVMISRELYSDLILALNVGSIIAMDVHQEQMFIAAKEQLIEEVE